MQLEKTALDTNVVFVEARLKFPSCSLPPVKYVLFLDEKNAFQTTSEWWRIILRAQARLRSPAQILAKAALAVSDIPKKREKTF